jgi:hypothetical protein
MIPYKLDYTIEKILKNKVANEKELLKELTGKSFADDNAKLIWTKIKDHKWLLSEKLGRDTGMRVAAIDYLENFYQFPTMPKTTN